MSTTATHATAVTPDGLLPQVPSGHWNVEVRDRSGKRHYFTDPLNSVTRAWAVEQEARFARGERRDPRAGEIKVSEWHKRRAAARGGKVSAPKSASLWKTHCEPKWADWPMNAVTRMEAQEWVAELQQTRRARHKGRPATGEDVPPLSAETIAAIVHVMSGLYRAAVKEHPPIVLSNPFADLELPTIEPRSVDFYEPDEALALYEAAAAIDPKWRPMIELGMQAGLRFGELAGLHGHRVDWLRGRVEVIDVMTRQGLRQWPKSKRSVKAAGIRRFPPRVMRHTAASWLVQDGVPLHDVQALLGHESFATTQRYHLAPDAHSRVLESWAKRRDGILPYERKEGRPS